MTGRVSIPEANIKIRQIPSGAVKPSPDVVIVSENRAKTTAPQVKIYTDVTVILGNNINFSGFGLTSPISGSIEIHETPGKIANGRGELVIVKGKYKAYGQDLDISQGRLFFSGGPVDNPGLAIQATRTAENGVIAGVNVTGTLQSPKLSVFSVPSMAIIWMPFPTLCLENPSIPLPVPRAIRFITRHLRRGLPEVRCWPTR